MALIRRVVSAFDAGVEQDVEEPFLVLHKTHHRVCQLLVEVPEVDEVAGGTADLEERPTGVVEEAWALSPEKAAAGLACEEVDRVAEDGEVEVLLGTWVAAACEEAVLACVVGEGRKARLEGAHADGAAAVVVAPGTALRCREQID